MSATASSTGAAAGSSSVAGFSSVEDALASFSKGEFVIVLDDEDRENEGDLIIAADNITTEQMAWFIRHTSGYICISVHPAVLSVLQIQMMVPNNTEKHKTAYTVTVDYKHHTTTGISAHDRALTARMLSKAAVLVPRFAEARKEADEEETVKSSSRAEAIIRQRKEEKDVPAPEDFSRPGHMVPLRYTEGGVRVRKGHTEASVDLCRACGKAPVALLCELVDPSSKDGDIAARDACLAFAREHNLKVITIEALRKWREAREGEKIPEVGQEAPSGQELDQQRKVAGAEGARQPLP